MLCQRKGLLTACVLQGENKAPVPYLEAMYLHIAGGTHKYKKIFDLDSQSLDCKTYYYSYR